MTIKKTAFAALAALSLLGSTFVAFAGTPFDGRWQVQVHTEDADCEVADAVPIRVANGNIRYGGLFGPSTTGHVDTSGALIIRIAYFGDVVNVAGQLDGPTGQGHWISPTLECTGTWIAERA